MSQTPVAFMALLFLLMAAWEWRRSPLRANLSLVVGAIFALAALEYPGESVLVIVQHTGDPLAWVVSGVRGLGLALIMVTLVAEVRRLQK